jgi:hypothetical protein
MAAMLAILNEEANENCFENPTTKNKIVGWVTCGINATGSPSIYSTYLVRKIFANLIIFSEFCFQFIDV